MIRALLLLFVCGWMLTSCSTQRVVCPAYQSAFIFDKPTQKETFVFYNENKNQPREVLASNSKKLTLPANDSSWSKSVVMPGPSLPKENRRKKERYLLLPKKTYRQALRALQTIPMKPVYPKRDKDSVDIKALLDSAARSISDSTLIVPKDSTTASVQEDSVYVISKEKEKFTSDQDNYMWYFRNILVLPDVRAAMQDANEAAKEKKKEEKAGAKKEVTKEKKGFFRSILDIFKKKPKEVAPADTIPVSISSEDDKLLSAGEVSETDSTVVTAPGTDSTKIKKPKKTSKKKADLLKKKTPAIDKKEPEKKKDPAKKEDDGFED